MNARGEDVRASALARVPAQPISLGSMRRKSSDRPADAPTRDDARLDPAGAPRDIEIEKPREMFRAIDDQRFVDGLAGLG